MSKTLDIVGKLRDVDETVRDAASAQLVAGANVELDKDDPGNTVTVNVPVIGGGAGVDPDALGDATPVYTGAERIAVKQGGIFKRVTFANLGLWITQVLPAFLAAGVSAVLRPLLDKLRETVDAADFGVVEGGVVNASVTLQAALDNTAGPGGSRLPVRLKPGGRYLLGTGGVVLNGPGAGFFVPNGGKATFVCPAAVFNNIVRDSWTANSTAVRGEGIARPIVRGVFCEFEVYDASARWLCGVSLRNCTDIDAKVDGSGLQNGYMLNIDTCTKGDVWETALRDSTTNRTDYVAITGAAPQITACSIDGSRIGGIGSIGIVVHRYYVKNVLMGAAAKAAYNADQTDGIHIRGNSFGGTQATRGIVVVGGYMDGVGEAFDILGDGCMVLGGHLRNITAIPVKIGYTSTGNIVRGLRCKGVGWTGVFFFAGAGAGAQSNLVEDCVFEDIDVDGFWTAFPAVPSAVTFNDGIGGMSISGNVVRNIQVLGNVANMQYAVYSKTNTGDLNKVIGITSPPGNLGYALIVAASGGAAGICEIRTDDGRVIRNAEVRNTLENHLRGANEKIWETVARDGTSTLEFRTRTDADVTGQTWLKVARTGTAVDLLHFSALAMKHGGVANATRYWETDEQGRVTTRFDDTSPHAWLTLNNYGITGVGQGPVRFINFGTGGVSGNAAFLESVLSTDTWAAGAQRSSMLAWDVTQANVLTRIMEASALGIKWSAPAPRVIYDETDAPANERLYDQLQTTGDLEYRTRTDADGAGKTWLLLQRTGTTVDLLRLDANAIRLGGVTASTRYTEISNQGVVTLRYDNAAASAGAMFSGQNYGITAAGHGLTRDVSFGTGGALGGVAVRESILATDTWGAAGNRSAQWLLSIMQANVLTQVADWTTTRLLATTGLLSSHASAGIGYATGAGGTVTQITSKATGVTLNRPSGKIAMHNAALAAGATVSFVLTNSAIAATDVLTLNHVAVGTFGAYQWNARCAAGSATIDITNRSGGSLSEAIEWGFVLTKGVQA